jgi:hypothetical protein
MVSPNNILKEFYEETEKDNLDQIRYLQSDIGEMNCLREQYSGDWEVVELCRSIIFENAHLIESLRKEIELARTASKGFKKL